MGVTGLWTVVKPCARPIKLETLNKKRLAVDASIWIYQFLKAVRDKEGNALRNSHVVGFFRRICKLLYFGIKPVFVFDGGAPVLKRQTITARKTRREGRREDAARTAGKLLAVQMQRRAEEENVKRSQPTQHDEPEEEIPENLVYVDELQMTPKERQQNRQFRKQDAYHLPEMDVSFEAMGAPDDPRIMSHEELEEYARQFHSGEDINLYDFSKIDFDSPFFLSLPASDRYNILNAARLRSRLRMGYSKEQLDTMFPDRMAFSKFQIERVRERNNLTQRLMNINGMNDDLDMQGIGPASRIAGERGREYMLVKDDTVEGGWALGVLSNRDEGKREKPIDVDNLGAQQSLADSDEWEDDEGGFEDVPIEGLNRLPKLPPSAPGMFDESFDQRAREIAERRRAVYESRQQSALQDRSLFEESNDALFVADETVESAAASRTIPEESAHFSDDEDLQRAIQMSLEDPGHNESMFHKPSPPLKMSHSAPKAQEPAHPDVADASDDDMDFSTAMAKSKVETSPSKPKPHRFDGPLPFESIKFTRKSENKEEGAPETHDDDTAGGFERPKTKNKENQELPPWFVPSLEKEKKLFISQEPEDRFSGVDTFRGTTDASSVLKNLRAPEIIDVDEETHESEAARKIQPDKNFPPQTDEEQQAATAEPVRMQLDKPTSGIANSTDASKALDTNMTGEEDEVIYDWEPSDVEDKTSTKAQSVVPDAGANKERILRSSPTPEFEDVGISNSPKISAAKQVPPAEDDTSTQLEPQAEVIPLYQDEGEFSDPEDDELMHQLAAEAEEHARFASTLNAKTQAENAFDYEKELKQLRSQQKKDRRDADEVSQIMISECQQLLRLFGLPYITAPMEAEAQCAELVSLGLVDGIVTDDSDTFLFGGTKVYKNMFNQAKYVECYLTSDLEKEYALDRKKLISFAHLLGSDYTEGIPGVGPVTALEILTEFGTLEEFQDWWSQVQMGSKTDSHTAFRKKFKKNLTKLFLPPGFPDSRVDSAYLEPEVDSDPSAFQWGVPDLNAIRGFLMSTIGWSQERTDEVLVPVIRDVNRRELEGTQSNITNFFTGPQGAGAFAPRRRANGTTRMEKAFSRLRHEAEVRQQRTDPATGDDEADNNNISDQSGTKRGSRKRQHKDDQSKDSDQTTAEKPPQKGRTKRKKAARDTTTEV